MKKILKNEKGFTVTELLVIMGTIIGGVILYLIFFK